MKKTKITALILLLSVILCGCAETGAETGAARPVVTAPEPETLPPIITADVTEGTGPEQTAEDTDQTQTAPTPDTTVTDAPGTTAAETEPVAQPKGDRVSFLFCGDNLAHDAVINNAKRYAEGKGNEYDFLPIYEDVARYIKSADVAVINQESQIAGDAAKIGGYPRFNTPSQMGDDLISLGFDVITTANNHMLDRYFEGMVNTVQLVDDHGFDHGGANRTPEEKDRPVVVTVNDIRVGMLCYTELTNAMDDYFSPEAEAYGVNYMCRADYAADVQRLRDAGAEVVLAMPHWGEEYWRRPEPNTVEQAKRLVAAGVDVILGGHPHMVQPVAFVEAQAGDGQVRRGLVAYSLGNFISNMCLQYTDSGIALDFTLRERPAGGFAVEDVRAVPIYCWRRDDMIQALCSMRYLNEAPKGMDAFEWARLKESYTELRELIDENIPMTEG